MEDNKRRVRIRHSYLPKQAFCPRCLKKLDVSTSISGWLVTEEYQCQHCGYNGPLFLEKSDEQPVQHP